MESNQKVWFLQVTRFLACALIVYIHWYGIITIPNTIHSLFMQDPIPNYPAVSIHEYLGLVIYKLGLSQFSGGLFAVGLFFILSGYVIPLSLKNSTPYSYLVRRLFRIYPVLLVCTFMIISIITFNAFILGSTMMKNLFHPKILFPNILLIRDFVHGRFIDNATWTLEIEMHFYLIIFGFFYFSKEKKMRTYLIASCVLLFLSNIFFYLNETWAVPKFFLSLGRVVNGNSGYLTFMFVGTSLYYTFSKQWSYIKGIVSIMSLLILNYFCLHSWNQDATIASLTFINNLYVLLFFVVLYFLNDDLPYSKIINKLAEISYPFYLLHGFTGYSIYFVFYHLTGNILIACISALTIVFLLAFLVHYKVELVGIEMSKDLVKGRVGKSRLVDFLLSRKMFSQRYNLE